MKILVTGGAGFIGSHTVDRLVQDGHQVVVIDDCSTGKRENVHPEATFIEADIRDIAHLSSIFAKEKPSHVVHLAALARVPLSIEDPVGTSSVNIMGTLHVLKAASDNKVERVVCASSSSVYGNQAILPLQEDMVPDPISPYALQKLTGEQFAKLFSSMFSLPAVSLRYFNVYGPRIDFSSDYSLVIGKFLRLQAEGKPLTIFGDGKQTRAFCYVSDVVEANVRALQSDKIRGGEIVNIGSENSYSVQEIADIIGGEVSYLPARPGDVLHTKADISLAKQLLGWQPEVEMQKGIQLTKDWFQDK